jgi:hypothetical protein
MSQHDFNIANQSFPATRTDINDAILAIVSNSSGDTEPSTTYANQWWYETDTNILKIRNEANDGWVDVITLDASMTATASELNQLDAITRGSILYGNASGETARLAAGGAATVLTSDGTDISWAAAGGGGGTEFIASVDASDDATISFTGFDSGSFDYYMFVFQNMVPATDNRFLRARTSTNGGSSYDSGSSDYRNVMQKIRYISTGYSVDATTDSYIALEAGNGTDNASASGGLSGTIQVFGAAGTLATHLISETITSSSFGTPNFFRTASMRYAAIDTDAIQFFYDSGNITSGTITMYGFKNA